MMKARRDLSSDYDIVVKGIIIGDSSVGKSSLLYRYTDQDWNPHYIATIGVDFKVMTFERKNKVVKLQLWDTAGQERFRTITHSYYRNSHGIMLVYDITNRESFENVSMWLNDVKKFGAADVPIVLVGNKADLESQRVVPKAEAEALAASLKCKVVETSAKDNTGVEAAFEYIVDKGIEARLKTPALPEKHAVRTLPKGTKVPEHRDTCAC